MCMFTDGSGYDVHAEIAKEDAQQHEVHPGMRVYLSINPWAIYVKEEEFFVSQGGLKDDWGKTWVGPIEAKSFAEARRIGEEMRLTEQENGN